MARMHSRKRGKSGSTHPKAKIKPDWVTYSKEEVIKLVVKLFKEGKSLSEIGGLLRDQYGIPSVKAVVGKSISEILREEKLLPKWPEDIMNLFKKAVRIRKHLENNKSDVHNKRALQLTESKIRRLIKYYKRKKLISSDWYYDPEKVRLLIKE